MQKNENRNNATLFASTCLATAEDEDEAIDGFTMAELQAMVFDGVAFARCTECGDISVVETDARDYDCQLCQAEHSVTSPLVKLGLI